MPFVRLSTIHLGIPARRKAVLNLVSSSPPLSDKTNKAWRPHDRRPPLPPSPHLVVSRPAAGRLDRPAGHGRLCRNRSARRSGQLALRRIPAGLGPGTDAGRPGLCRRHRRPGREDRRDGLRFRPEPSGYPRLALPAGDGQRHLCRRHAVQRQRRDERQQRLPRHPRRRHPRRLARRRRHARGGLRGTGICRQHQPERQLPVRPDARPELFQGRLPGAGRRRGAGDQQQLGQPAQGRQLRDPRRPARRLCPALRALHLAGRRRRRLPPGRDQRLQRRQQRLRQRQRALRPALLPAGPGRPLAGRVRPRPTERPALQPLRHRQVLVHHHARPPDQQHHARRRLRQQVRYLDGRAPRHRRAGPGHAALSVPEQRAGAAGSADHRHPARRHADRRPHRHRRLGRAGSRSGDAWAWTIARPLRGQPPGRPARRMEQPDFR